MATSKPILTYAEGMQIASNLIAMLEPYTERIEVAGSLRRRMDANDVELVAVPRRADVQPGLLADMNGTAKHNYLDFEIADGMERGTFTPRHGKDGKQAVGEKFKRLWYSGVAIDLFSVLDTNHWGGVFAIRTGPAQFSRLCVTPRWQGGAMPAGMRQQDGKLWRGDQPVPCTDESAWFDAIGVPIIKPSERSEEWLRAFLKGQRR